MAAQPGLSPISWAASIDPIFLQSLLVIRVFGTGLNDVSNLTDGIIKAKLTELSSGSRPVSFDEALADVNATSALTSLNRTHESASSFSKPVMWSISSVVVGT